MPPVGSQTRWAAQPQSGPGSVKRCALGRCSCAERLTPGTAYMEREGSKVLKKDHSMSAKKKGAEAVSLFLLSQQAEARRYCDV